MLDGRLAGIEEWLRAPPRMNLSEWADKNFYLSAESSAEPGRWRTYSYQREIMDVLTDPSVELVTWMKCARVGATKIMGALIGYHIDQDPCPMLLVQPAIEDAEGYSKEEIAPMIRDCPVLAAKVIKPTAKISEQTILHKSFPGGILSMTGANSGRGFRRVSRRLVMFDEVDGYPPSAGTEGDQIELGIKRTEYYWNRKIYLASTPLIKGASRIETSFLAGDQRRYHVPCPHCGHEDYLVFNQKSKRGHWMQWPEGEPLRAYFVCRKNGCVIEESSKRTMLEAGRWVAEAPFRGHASFHIWAGYSYSPNSTWGKVAARFVKASKEGPEKLKTFVNTDLAETWQEMGEAPDWELLYARREHYPIESVPEGVVLITAGVDVQKDRLMYEVVGWGRNKESWSIDAGEISGDPAAEATWQALDEQVVDRVYDGRPVRLTAVDSGYSTQQVYAYARRRGTPRVVACKGVDQSRMLVNPPSPVDVTIGNRRIQRGLRIRTIGVSIGKSELYGWLRLRIAEGQPVPPGYCHFPELSEEYFKQLTSEHLVTVVSKRTGQSKREWQVQPGRENHYLDCRILARAAASICGLDKYRGQSRPGPASAAPAPAEALEGPVQPREAGEVGETGAPSATAPRARARESWLPRRRGGWLGARNR